MATSKPASSADAQTEKASRYVGTLVGESTSSEFRLAVAHGAIREQDIIAVDAQVQRTDGGMAMEQIRIWAKVQHIERLNPLFPAEAGHELAATHTDPFDTVLSLSREMVTATCQVLGCEPIEGAGGKLDHLRYPAKPASTAYRPNSNDIERVVVGELQQRKNRALDLATLSNRRDVDVKVDGHAIVSRHLAILAMTGAGKSVTARRIIEQLAEKNYPIVIFDPHGDYTGLADVPELSSRVKRYYAQFPIFEQDPETVARVVQTLGWEFANSHRNLFEDLFKGALAFISGTPADLQERAQWLSEYLGNPNIARYGLRPNLYFMADFVQAVVEAGKREDHDAQSQILEWSDRPNLRLDKRNASWLEGLPGNLRTAAKQLREMEDISKRTAVASEALPTDKAELVRYGGISIIGLAGYSGDFQATLYSLVASKLFSKRVTGDLKLPLLLLLEEAHNFAPGHADTTAEKQAIMTTRQIAQEGRKFGVGLILISQRPSRLDETTLSQCNSFIIMRMVNPADQNFVKKVIESLGEDEARMLPDLDVGEAILSGQLINFPVLVKIKPSVSKGEREERDAFAALEEAREAMKKSAEK